MTSQKSSNIPPLTPKSWQKYGLIFRLTLQNVLSYRLDFFLHTFKYTMMVLMLSLVWLAVGKQTANPTMTTIQTVQYFFFAAMVYTLSNFHTNEIEEDIRLGGLSKYLLKPIHAIWYYCWFHGTEVCIETGLKIFIMVPVLWWLGYGFQILPVNTLLAIAAAPLIFLFSYHLFTLISLLSFWIAESWAIRWGLMIIFRFLAGILMPLSFFPTAIQEILWWLPFPHLANTPIQLLLGEMSISTALFGFSILLGWTGALMLVRHWLWNIGLKSYEGGGI